ncbi:hypothetical protein SESBI_44226 [Sesbania bispinosa]|nr:hypothetical protein SESBI_44226 [Sesbania bispinosa]
MGQCEKPIVKVEVEPFQEEQINTTKVFEDTDVDIVSWTNKGDLASNKNEDPDATEYSSSFADTTSDAENCSRLSDAEVESECFGDNGLACGFNTLGSAFRIRKKKLTDHWRNYIRPVMWRCKWAELRIKEIDSQAVKYGKELAEYDKRKHMEPDHSTLDEFGSKSLPFSSDQYRKNKKSDPDGSLADDFDNPVITEPIADSTDRFGIGEDQPFLEFSEADASLEQLLWTIDNLQSRVHKLKGDVEAVMSKNASKFSSSENLSLLPHGDVQTSSAQSPATSAGNGDAASVGGIYNSTQHVAGEYDFGDLVMHDGAVSSYGQVTIIPDIIESTVGLLSAADVTLHPALVGDSCEAMVDNVLIHEVAETEDHTLKSGSHYPIEKLQDMDKSEVEESLHPVSVPMSDFNTETNSAVSQEQCALKSCISKDVNFPKNKRKRGERKAGSGGWSKKCSGEPDNQ